MHAKAPAIVLIIETTLFYCLKLFSPKESSKAIVQFRVMFSKKIILYGGDFDTISLYNQKVDVHHIKRSKAKELGAIRPQRPKFFWLGKNFFLVFSMN